jgi:hypothetical protein
MGTRSPRRKLEEACAVVVARDALPAQTKPDRSGGHVAASPPSSSRGFISIAATLAV